MKTKIYSMILFFLLSLLVSCSRENNETENQNVSTLRLGSQNELETAKRLFLEMMNTNEYVSYNNELRIFISKLNGNVVPLFRNRTESNNWIIQNLARTNFVSIQEFEMMIDSMEEKYRIIMARNQQVFSLMQNADESQFLEIVEPSLGSLPVLTVNSDCADSCMNTASSAIDSLDADYRSETQSGNPWRIIVAVLTYWSSFESIVDNLNGCLANC